MKDKKIKPLYKFIIGYVLLTLGVTIDFQVKHYTRDVFHSEDIGLVTALTIDTRRFHPSIPFVIWVSHDRSPYNLNLYIKTKNTNISSITVEKLIISSEKGITEKLFNENYKLLNKDHLFYETSKGYAGGKTSNIQFAKIIKNAKNVNVSILYTVNYDNGNSVQLSSRWEEERVREIKISTMLINLLGGFGASGAA